MWMQHVYLLLCVSLELFTPSWACPVKCACRDGRVSCYGSQLREIPANIPKDTLYLDLRSNNIININTDRLSHLTQLKEFMLSHNSLKKIKRAVFKPLVSLETLKINSNMLSTLEPGAFDGLGKLTSLYLAYNKITDIAGAFRNLTSLTRLDVGENQINVLTAETFLDLKNLLYLTIPHNNISTIEMETFVPLTKLSYITINNNPIVNASTLFYRNYQLSYIDLSECKLIDVPKGLPRTTRNLTLERNNITRIRKTSFYSTPFIVILGLNENQISRIDRGAFSRTRYIRELWLNGNKLKQIPRPLPRKVSMLFMTKNFIGKLSDKDFQASSLTHVALDGNIIATISQETFSRVRNLTQLKLNSNKLTKLESGTFRHLGQLEVLLLSNNKLTMIQEGAFQGLSALRRLEMAFIVDIHTIVQGNIFAELTNLQYLDVQLSPNIAKQLLSSDVMLSSLSNLTELNLMDNELTTANQNLQLYLTSIKIIKLINNKWHCDTRLQWLSAWVRANKEIFFMRNKVQCYTPTTDRGLPIWTLTQFVPVTTTELTASVATTDVNTSRNATTIADIPNLKTTITPTKHIITKELVVKWTQKYFIYTSTLKIPRINENTTPPVTTKLTTTHDSFKTLTVKTSIFDGIKNLYPTDGTQSATTNYKFTNISKMSNDSTNYTEENGTMDFHEVITKGQSKTIIISAIIATVAFIGIITGVVIFILVRIRQNNIVYHRALQYKQDYSDVVFFVGEPQQDIINTRSKIMRTRSEQGSTSSRPSEDITSDMTLNMKVYSWDDK